MASQQSEGISSTMSIAGHPIHPILIPYPIAFLSGAFITDLVYWITNNPFWAQASVWLIGAGLVMGALAAVVGLIDFLTIERAREPIDGWIHFLGMLGVEILAIVNLFLRPGDPAAAILPWGLILSAVTAGLLGIAGWFGGELAYRHMIGVIGQHKKRGAQRSTGEPVQAPG